MNISEFSKDAVCQYLRSVVLIDDALFNLETVQSLRADTTLDSLPSLGENSCEILSNGASDSVMQVGDGQPQTNEDLASANRVDAYAITDAFATKGIICGVYKPTFFPEKNFKDEPGFGTLLNICKNADVFILDWNLFAENAKAVILLLKQLLLEDEGTNTPKPLRFCAIYTAENADRICEVVFSAIQEIVSAAKKEETARKVCAEGLTVCIYAKEEATSSDAIAATNLADKIISDYAKTYEGILPALALRGVASIRNNVKRVLDKFPADMDPALVLHAGLMIQEKCISQNIATLIGDEIAALLEDKRVQDETIYDLCSEYVRQCSDSVFNKTGDGKIDAPILQNSTSADVKGFIQRVFSQHTFFPKNENGVFTPVFKDCKESNKSGPRWRLVRLLGQFVSQKASQTGKYKIGAFSALFCHRTNYADLKTLRFGAVVKELTSNGGVERYYLCLMPLCDSIRLVDQDATGQAKRHKFPFWNLTEVPKDFQGRNHGLVLKGGDGNYHAYCVKGKIRENFSLFEFNSHGSIVRFDRCGIVRTADGVQSFEWVAELKSAHIQRMAEFVSREFSRIGLTESEWLRLQVNR